MIRAVFLLAAVFLPPLFAHSVEVFRGAGSTPFPVETAQFRYSTGENMAFAKVKLYSPSSLDVDVLQSVTDINGYFSFVPNEAGKWRVIAEDGMGHRGEISAVVSAEAINKGGGDLAEGGISPLFRALLGISLIFNIFAAISYIRKRAAFSKEQ